ncbi:LamG-like jellyroll fold domain-containing protein [Streptomyces roseus]|uniref:LamG-like jellyroll fold domain-containing protein n=1 Tax=Streptomyces roseus TaxID=66430 RepID=UPI000B0DD0A8
MPGRAFRFDGKDQYLSLPAGRHQAVAPVGDLSLEAWVNPEAGQGRIIHARTDESAYSLGLAAAGLPVRQFVGTAKAELTGALDLSHRDFTIELWAKRNQSRARREPLLVHGALDGRLDQTLHLHFTPDEKFVFALFADDLTTAQSYPDLEWHHWAAVYKHATREQILYRDGTEVGRRTATGAYAGIGPLVLGHHPFTGDHLDGQIDEVRVFGRARTHQEISAERHQRLSGREPGLLGHWTSEGTGSPASPIKGYQVVARVGDRVFRSAERFPCNEWAHLAATFTQSWALRLDGSEGLSVAPQNSLDVLEDLTIEAFVQLDRLGTPMGILAKDAVVDGGREGVPYQLGVLADGRLEFAFAEADGKAVRYTSDRAVTPGVLERVTVVRQRRKPEVSAASQANAGVRPEQDIRFYLGGVAAGSHVYGGPGAQSNTAELIIGRGLRGVLCEVRLWNSARPAVQLGLPVTPREKGLLARWPFDENAGNVTSDISGSFPAKLRGARWTRDVDPTASPLRVYRNGDLLSEGPTTAQDKAPFGDVQLTLGAGLAGGKPVDLLTGTLEEVRIWRTVRTREQIHDNLFTRLRGDKQPARLLAVRPGLHRTRQHLGARRGPARQQPGLLRQAAAHPAVHRPRVHRHRRGAFGARRRPHPLPRHHRRRTRRHRVRRPPVRRQGRGGRRPQALLRIRPQRPLAPGHRVQGGRPDHRVGRPGPVRPAADGLRRGRPARALGEPHRQARRLPGRVLGGVHRGRPGRTEPVRQQDRERTDRLQLRARRRDRGRHPDDHRAGRLRHSEPAGQGPVEAGRDGQPGVLQHVERGHQGQPGQEHRAQDEAGPDRLHRGPREGAELLCGPAVRPRQHRHGAGAVADRRRLRAAPGPHRRAGRLPDAAQPGHPPGLERHPLPDQPPLHQAGHPGRGGRLRRPRQGHRSRLPHRHPLRRVQLLQTPRRVRAQAPHHPRPAAAARLLRIGLH